MEEKRLPDYEEIINLEKISQKNGSAIKYEQLIGTWRLRHIWKKGSNQVDNISSSILQVLYATLELSQKKFQDNVNYNIKNSIKFGFLTLIFSGNAFLKGERPILSFYFVDLKVKVLNLTLFNKDLTKPDANQMPFFSLIYLNKIDNWMCARGKGGGLAIWIKH